MRAIIFFILFQPFILYSQLNDAVISVENISDSCEFGKKLIIRDKNKNNIYNELRRYNCDNSTIKDSLIVIGENRELLSGIVGKIEFGEFENKSFLIRLYDPFKNETWAYLSYDSLNNYAILNFNTSNVDDLISISSPQAQLYINNCLYLLNFSKFDFNSMCIMNIFNVYGQKIDSKMEIDLNHNNIIELDYQGFNNELIILQFISATDVVYFKIMAP